MGGNESVLTLCCGAGRGHLKIKKLDIGYYEDSEEDFQDDRIVSTEAGGAALYIPSIPDKRRRKGKRSSSSVPGSSTATGYEDCGGSSSWFSEALGGGSSGDTGQKKFTTTSTAETISVVILGNSGVGKSSLINAYIWDTFKDQASQHSSSS